MLLIELLMFILEKFGKNLESISDLIETVKGVGYRFKSVE